MKRDPQNNQLEALLSKPVSRKEFLQHIGILVASLIGLSGLLRYLTNGDFKSISEKLGDGYGHSSFGGKGRISKD